ncbi:MAG TPA: hypothetical protein VM452_00230 [Caulifigura sp.]|jgi:hypothetical protein|nr:hypothetical protein [Caulifigura sp.]
MTREEAISLAARWYPPDAQLLHTALSRTGVNVDRPLWLLRFGRCQRIDGFATRVVSSSIVIDDKSGQPVRHPDEWD